MTSQDQDSRTHYIKESWACENTFLPTGWMAAYLLDWLAMAGDGWPAALLNLFGWCGAITWGALNLACAYLVLMSGLSWALLKLPGIFLGLMGLARGSPWALSGASWNNSTKYASLVPTLDPKIAADCDASCLAGWLAGWLFWSVRRKNRHEVYNMKPRPFDRLLGCFLAAPELCVGAPASRLFSASSMSSSSCSGLRSS